jgi:hypothetical protein
MAGIDGNLDSFESYDTLAIPKETTSSTLNLFSPLHGGEEDDWLPGINLHMRNKLRHYVAR